MNSQTTVALDNSIIVTNTDPATGTTETVVINQAAGVLSKTVTDALGGSTSSTMDIPPLDDKLITFARCIAADINDLQNALEGADHTNASAISTLQAQVDANLLTLESQILALINDNALNGTNLTWSVDKIMSFVNAQITAGLGGLSPEILNTLAQLEAQLAADGSLLTQLLNGLSGVVRFDQAQGLTSEQAAQARQNIGAISGLEVDSKIADAVANIHTGATFVDLSLCAVFSAARAARVIPA